MFSLKKKMKQIGLSMTDPNVLVAEIHNEFDSVTERLLTEAREILSANPEVQKGERLKSLGFVNTKSAKAAEEIVKKKKEAEKTAELVEYFRVYYPNYKFITDAAVKAICQKYGLVFGDSYYYIGDVPEKNIQEMERFELRQEDMYKGMIVELSSGGMSGYTGGFFNGFHPTQSYKGYFAPSEFSSMSFHHVSKEDEDKEFVYHKQPTKICAPFKEFHTDSRYGLSKDGYNMELKDPVVLQPVNGGYLIITKWGLEGKDESLVNEIQN